MEKNQIARAPSQFQVRNGGSRCDSDNTKITCFVFAISYGILRCFNMFQRFFTLLLFRPFFWKNASSGSWRSPPLSEKKYVHPELSFIEGCACDLTILKFSRIIESTIASFQIMLNPFDCHKTTLASFLDALHTNSANHTVPRHKVPPTPKKHSKTNLL